MVDSIKKQLTPKKFKAQDLNKSPGIFDDYAVRKSLHTREGTITKTPVDPDDIANKAYVDASSGLWEVDGTETQLKTADEIDMQTKKILNVVDPTADQEAATKKYVDDNLHPESHSIASHNDTTGTGAELNALTDNSMADALHRHSELSASDGTPDKIVYCDTDGKLHADKSPTGLDVLYNLEVGTLNVNTNITLGGTVDGIDIATDVAANTAKNTNVTTNLSLGVGNATTEIILSSDGTDVTLIEADTDNAGLLGAAKWDEIVANTLKNTNVTTNLSAGTRTATTMKVDSSDGTDATLVEADTTNAGILGSDKWDEIVAATTHLADNSQAHSDYLLNSEADVGVGLTLTGDNSAADTQYTAQVLYNTDATPPAASGFPIGTIYIQYTA